MISTVLTIVFNYAIPFFLVISILVFFHELGHSLAAKHVGVRVQQFSIGFPPRAYSKKWGETEYILSWLPIGGYVKLEGQNIEDENPNDPRNYASKTILQRLYILAAGPAMNLLLALVVMPFVFLIGVETAAYRLEAPRIVSTAPDSPANKAGFLGGDTIVRVGEVPVATWNDVFRRATRQALSADTVAVTVQRGQRQLTLVLDGAPLAAGRAIGWRPLRQPEVGRLVPGSAAEQAGLREGDRIVSINATAIHSWGDIPDRIQLGRGSEAAFEIRRGEETFVVKITPRPSGEEGRWLIGISPRSRRVRHGVVESVKLGTERLWEITGATFAFLGRLLTGGGSMDALGGPVKIGKVIGDAASAGFVETLFLVAVISLQLGIFNLFPIPALDGGHIFMLGLEKLKGGPLNARIRERAQMVGFSLLILLILIVTSNDILGFLS
ncbi:MAG: RIP metalloprotease RseP [bacterium]